MTDEQFDEICRNSLAYEPGRATEATWSKIRMRRWSWLPTIPEILVCGCTCGLALLIVGIQVSASPPSIKKPNSVIQTAMKGTLSGLQASAIQIPDARSWTDVSISLPDESRTAVKERRLH